MKKKKKKLEKARNIFYIFLLTLPNIRRMFQNKTRFYFEKGLLLFVETMSLILYLTQ